MNGWQNDWMSANGEAEEWEKESRRAQVRGKNIVEFKANSEFSIQALALNAKSIADRENERDNKSERANVL